MWLALFSLLTLNAPPQNGPASAQDFRGKLPNFKIDQAMLLPRRYFARDLSFNKDTCYAIRSYLFRRNDGQAPVLVNTTICTPANTVRHLQVSPAPVRLVPAMTQDDDQK